MFSKKISKLFVVLFLFSAALFLIYVNKTKLVYYSKYLPYLAQSTLKAVFSKNSYQRISNDYNEKFIPETQLINLKFKKIKLDFLSGAEKGYFQKQVKKTGNVYKSFYIDVYQTDKLIITDTKGKSVVLNFSNYENNIKIEKITKLDNDLMVTKILDTLVIDETIFTSYIEEKNNCRNFVISKSDINNQSLSYNEFFRDETCAGFIQGGRMQPFFFENKKGILFTIADNIADNPNNDPQSDNSNFGKIIFKSFDEDRKVIFSKGHRNPQGLIVLEDVILETEHGPKGGDEINKIIYKGNYGWPISSYGKKYDSNQVYKQSHEDQGFQEPIFSFVPSIGISELIKVPNSFTKEWEKNFLISSLNKQCLFRVKFDQNFNRIIYLEEIFIGQRIRDLKYSQNHIFLALENEGEIGILSKIN